MSTEGKSPHDRLKPISLWPLTPEKALGLFMEVDPEKVKEAEKREKEKRKWSSQ